MFNTEAEKHEIHAATCEPLTVRKLTRETVDTFVAFLLQPTTDEGVWERVESSVVEVAESRSKRANIWTTMRIHNAAWHSVQLDDSPQHYVTPRVALLRVKNPAFPLPLNTSVSVMKRNTPLYHALFAVLFPAWIIPISVSVEILFRIKRKLII